MRFLVPGKKVAKGSCSFCAEHNLVFRAHFPIKVREKSPGNEVALNKGQSYGKLQLRLQFLRLAIRHA